MIKTYQWTKGERLGQIVKTIGETFKEDNIEYLVFNDGSMINTSLMGEYLIEIPSESEAMLMSDIAPQPMQRVEAKKPIQANVVKVDSLSPIQRLLTDCKKIPTEYTFTVQLPMPSLDLIRVLADTYENGNEQVLEFLVSSIKFDDVKETLAEKIRETLFDKE